MTAWKLSASELEVGAVYGLGTRSLSDTEIIDFATEWDPQDFHVDPVSAADHEYGEVIASGVHTFAVWMRMAVDTVYREWAVVAGRSIQDMRFLRPVRAGATLHGELVVDGIETSGRYPDRALVRHRAVLRDDDGVLVFTAVLDAYLLRTPPIEKRNRDDD